MGKKISSRISDEYVWFSIGDSHSRELLTFFSSYGISAAAISGGGVALVKQYLASHNYHNGRISCYFVLIGGNDLDANKPAKVIVREICYLVQEISKRNPDCVVITGSVIPRGKGDQFLCLSEGLDQEMAKFAINHHHFLSDLFVAAPCGRARLVQPRLNLYKHDLTHLNAEGLELYKQLLTFIISCVNWGDFKGKLNVPCGRESRSVLWKF